MLLLVSVALIVPALFHYARPAGMQIEVVRSLTESFPDFCIMSSGYTYLQEFLPNVAQAVVRQGWAAKREGRPEFARFAEKLMLHAQTEEEVLHPATLVLGEVLRQRGVKG